MEFGERERLLWLLIEKERTVVARGSYRATGERKKERKRKGSFLRLPPLRTTNTLTECSRQWPECAEVVGERGIGFGENGREGWEEERMGESLPPAGATVVFL